MSGSAPSASQFKATSERLEAARSRLGRVVAGRWTLKAVLGAGGTATVYEAVHRNGRRAALKVLHPEFSSSSKVGQRLLSEGYAANKVEHPGAVLVLDDGEDDGCVFLVMELLKGRSLADRLSDEGPLPAVDVTRISAEILDVLAAAHDRGVIHRDVKPSNVFELESGSIKVLDFGVAQVREPGSQAITQSGFTVGTPAFMAPEQAGGRVDEIDELTDIWAVGAAMFQLLSGKLVHDATTPNAALVAAATTQVKPLRSVRSDVPLELAAIVDRALAFRREDRWPNARAMRRALLRTLPHSEEGRGSATTEDVDAETMPEAALRHPTRLHKRASLWLVIAASIGLALALGASLLAPRAQPPAVPAAMTPSTTPIASLPPSELPALAATPRAASSALAPSAAPSAHAAPAARLRPKPSPAKPDDAILDRRK